VEGRLEGRLHLLQFDGCAGHVRVLEIGKGALFVCLESADRRLPSSQSRQHAPNRRRLIVYMIECIVQCGELTANRRRVSRLYRLFKAPDFVQHVQGAPAAGIVEHLIASQVYNR